MKKFAKTSALLALLAFALTSCGPTASGGGFVRANKGPLVDRILVNARTQEDIAIKDAAEGKSDVFWYDTNGSTYKSLTDEVRSKLETYAVPSGRGRCSSILFPISPPTPPGRRTAERLSIPSPSARSGSQ